MFSSRKTATKAGVSILNREIYCAGFSLAIDKLVLGLSQLNDLNQNRSVVDLVVYVTGRPPLKDVTQILKSLWAAGIKCCFVEAPNQKDDEDMLAKDLGANHIIILDDGVLRVKTWQNDRYDERKVTRSEVIEYLMKNVHADVNTLAESFQQLQGLPRNNSLTNISGKNFEAPTAGVANLDVIFIMTDKPALHKRKRLENQIEQKLENVMQKFNKKETFTIFAVDLESKQIKALIGCIDPNPKTQSLSELDTVLEK